MFTASTAMPFADLSGAALGIELRQANALKFYIGILVTEEDDLKVGEPSTRWQYVAQLEDYIEWYFRKIE